MLSAQVGVLYGYFWLANYCLATVPLANAPPDFTTEIAKTSLSKDWGYLLVAAMYLACAFAMACFGESNQIRAADGF